MARASTPHIAYPPIWDFDQRLIARGSAVSVPSPPIVKTDGTVTGAAPEATYQSETRPTSGARAPTDPDVGGHGCRGHSGDNVLGQA